GAKPLSDGRRAREPAGGRRRHAPAAAGRARRLMHAGRRLASLIARDGTLQVPEAPFPLAARAAAEAGFEAVYCGGYTLSGLYLGLPDHGVITTTELLDHARRLVDTTELPVICDVDQGGETSLNVA